MSTDKKIKYYRYIIKPPSLITKENGNQSQ